MPLLTVAIGLAAIGQSPNINAGQFARLMDGAFSEIRDATFVYEGGLRFVGPAGLAKVPVETFEFAYQGTYAYRSDESILVDCYQRGIATDAPFAHQTAVLFDEELIEANRVPDLDEYGVSTTSGAPGSLDRTASPQRIFNVWYFQQHRDPAAWGYEFQGWESVGGHRCLRVQFNLAQGATEPDRDVVRYWLDMARGGHALKVEHLEGDNLRMRTDKIRLREVAMPGGVTTWFPIGGRTEAFLWEEEYHRSPVMRETYEVMVGSILLNQNLGDEVFSVDWRGGLPETPELVETREAYDAVPPRPPVRTDPEGVQLHLDEMMEEADRRAPRLDASPASRRSWGATHTVSYGLGLFGFLVIVTSLIWKRRMG